MLRQHSYIKYLFCAGALFLFFSSTLAHPTGQLIVADNTVLWSYVCPLDDADHHACIMAWDEESGVYSWLTSSYPASDWMLSPASDGGFYIIERYYDAVNQSHKVRLMSASVDSEPQEILPWFEDTHRFGEAGFAVLDSGHILFARYPNLYVLDGTGSIKIWRKWEAPVLGLRLIDENSLLIRGESDAWLTNLNGEIIQKWSDLLQPLDSEPPLLGNRIFDADFIDGNLWLAYWGKRHFEVINGKKRSIIKSFDAPWLPHAIAVSGNSVFMLASTISPGENSRILPNLWQFQDDSLKLLWDASTPVISVTELKLATPVQFTLHQNHPNPFNPSTIIQYEIPTDSKVTLKIYNILGEEIRTLVDNIQARGRKSVVWDGKDHNGRLVSSGIYFCRLNFGESIRSRKMLLLK